MCERKIDNMCSGVTAFIEDDGNGDYQLCFEVRPNTGGNFRTNFNIQWLLHDPEKVDWLAYVVGHKLKEAFEDGCYFERRKTSTALDGLRGLLGVGA